MKKQVGKTVKNTAKKTTAKKTTAQKSNGKKTGAVTKKTVTSGDKKEQAQESKGAVTTTGNPYRPGSAYSKTFDCLYDLTKKSENGIVSRFDVLAEVVKVTGKQENLARFNLAVIISPRKDGTSHKSAKKACDAYYIEPKENGMLSLVMREKAS